VKAAGDAPLSLASAGVQDCVPPGHGSMTLPVVTPLLALVADVEPPAPPEVLLLPPLVWLPLVELSLVWLPLVELLPVELSLVEPLPVELPLAVVVVPLAVPGLASLGPQPQVTHRLPTSRVWIFMLAGACHVERGADRLLAFGFPRSPVRAEASRRV